MKRFIRIFFVLTLMSMPAMCLAQGFYDVLPVEGLHNLGGLGIAALEILAVLFFMILVLKKSDKERRELRSRYDERHKFIPPEPKYDNLTTNTFDMATDRDKAFNPFAREAQYAKQANSIFEMPVDFDNSRAANHNGTSNVNPFYTAEQDMSYTNIPKSNPDNYPGHVSAQGQNCQTVEHRTDFNNHESE